MAEAICNDETISLTSQQRMYLKEQFWEELFQEKCVFSVQQNEIVYVQENVEIFISKVIQRVLESETYKRFISAVDKKDQIQFNQHFSINNLLRVGSFYEGTKNSYPDEFDFIFVLAEYSAKVHRRLEMLTSELSDLFHEVLERVLSGPIVEQGAVFEEWSLCGLHGPASKIKVVFKETEALRERVIYFDISAASRIRLETCLPKEIKACYNEWTEMILETGSVLAIKVYRTDHPKRETRVKITITETEQYFVRHVMTENHRKVYRLLKYIFNGNDANEVLKRLVRRPDNKQTAFSRLVIGENGAPRIVYDLPSYALKTLMFHHVHRCQRAEEGVAECLLDVLRSLLETFSVNTNLGVIKPYFEYFSISVCTMIRQPLEVSDDETFAASFRKQLSRLVKTVEKVQQTEAMHASLEEQIPFTEQQVDTVQNVLDLRLTSRPSQSFKNAKITYYIIMVLFTSILAIAMIAYYEVGAGDTSNTSNVQYCCTGGNGRSERWRNVTCSKSNNFTKHSNKVSDSLSTELKETFACMALTAAVGYSSNDTAVCSGNLSKFTEEVEMCLYCNVPIEDPRDHEALLPTLNQGHLCSCLAHCRPAAIGMQVNSFLKIQTDGFNDVQIHEHSNCDTDNSLAADNCTSFPLQTCTGNTTSNGWTEICCSNSESDPNGQTDQKTSYKGFMIFGLTSLGIAGLIGLSYIFLRRRNKTFMTMFWESRQHANHETGTSIQETS